MGNHVHAFVIVDVSASKGVPTPRDSQAVRQSLFLRGYVSVRLCMAVSLACTRGRKKAGCWEARGGGDEEGGMRHRLQ